MQQMLKAEGNDRIMTGCCQIIMSGDSPRKLSHLTQCYVRELSVLLGVRCHKPEVMAFRAKEHCSKSYSFTPRKWYPAKLGTHVYRYVFV